MLLDVLINIILICCILGLAWWAISAIPMPGPISVIARVVFALVAIILLLGAFNALPTLHIYHYHYRR
jgi:heme A synthase